MIKKAILLYLNLFTILIIAVGCRPVPGEKELAQLEPDVKFQGVQKVSIIALIGSPQKYNGCLVRVIGYVNLEFEGNGIYLHKDDYELGIEKNALWIELEGTNLNPSWAKRCNRQYVILEGRFQMENQGHMASFSGAIKKITRIERLNN
jgi:hypothetical protein